MATPLSYAERNSTAVDLNVTLHANLFDDGVSAVTLNTSKGLFVGEATNLADFKKVYSKFMRTTKIEKVFLILNDITHDVTESIHTPAFEINKLSNGTFPLQ